MIESQLNSQKKNSDLVTLQGFWKTPSLQMPQLPQEGQTQILKRTRFELSFLKKLIASVRGKESWRLHRLRLSPEIRAPLHMKLEQLYETQVQTSALGPALNACLSPTEAQDWGLFHKGSPFLFEKALVIGFELGIEWWACFLESIIWQEVLEDPSKNKIGEFSDQFSQLLDSPAFLAPTQILKKRDIPGQLVIELLSCPHLSTLIQGPIALKDQACSLRMTFARAFLWSLNPKILIQLRLQGLSRHRCEWEIRY